MSNVTHSQQLTRRRRRDSRHGPDKLGLSEGDHRRRCLLTFTGKINIIHSRHGCDCTNVLQLPKRSSAAVLFEPYNLEKIEKKKCAKPATKQTTKEAKRVNQNRDLGLDPTTSLPVSARFGKYGPYVQLGTADDEEKPKYAKMRPGQLIESITLAEALELFKLPRNIGLFEDKDVLVDVGRFGPYVRHDNKFTSIPKDVDPYEIELTQAIDLIKAKREQEANKYINEFEHEGEKIEVLNGRWGPYIKKGRSNFKIPKGTKAEELNLEQTLEIIKNAPAKTKKGKSRSKK